LLAAVLEALGFAAGLAEDLLATGFPSLAAGFLALDVSLAIGFPFPLRRAPPSPGGSLATVFAADFSMMQIEGNLRNRLAAAAWRSAQHQVFRNLIADARPRDDR
jgi:hypothetical protein